MSALIHPAAHIPRVTVNAVFSAVLGLALGACASRPAPPSGPYYGTIEVQPGSPIVPGELRGRVFIDANRNSVHDAGEVGLAGVAVSNGHAVVLSDSDGRYALPVASGASVFISKPAGYAVPTDADFIPQFAYHHLPEGSPELTYGGLPPSGPLPQAVNFPLWPKPTGNQFRALVVGDTQTYNDRELGYLRDSLLPALQEVDDAAFLIIEGDILGDDLSLFPRLKTLLGTQRVPVYLVPGNHDLDFDATADAASFDTFRRAFGPSYYSFNEGQVHFVVLDSVRYPCTPAEDNADGRRPECDNPASAPRYNGVIDAKQMAWLRADLEQVPPDHLIVLNSHIPLRSFVDQDSPIHQIDNAAEIYALLEGRAVLSLAGHTHTISHFEPGEHYAGWAADGVPATPFRQILVGAACGSWWSGDPASDGVPAAWQRLGAPRGHFVFRFDGTQFRERFRATGYAPDRQMSVGLVTPAFRDAYAALSAWQQQPKPDPVPPLNTREFPDPWRVPVSALRQGTDLVVNVWNGAASTTVHMRLGDGPPVSLERTQQGAGEGKNPVLDPVALRAQLGVSAYAWQSRSGQPEGQGFGLFRKFRQGPAPPQPLPAWMHTTASTHIWTAPLPADLPPGVHRLEVTARDRYARVSRETYVLEVIAD